ncbi:MAG: AAA family ATPase [Thiovulaceae bacterium]|nr:AAA family ATPase [Sulfurimonadaceae bacterium]
MQNIVENSKRLYRLKLNQTLPEYKRYLYEEIAVQKSKIVGLYGSRGVGKTTLLLQVLKELDYPENQKLYISCDHPIFQEISLFDFVDEFSKKGGEVIVIDEIHQANDFQKNIKLIYDFLNIKVFFSGSSAVEITNADFARRYAMYHLPILSLREYLEFSQNISLKSYRLEDLLQNHENIAFEIFESLKDKKILKYFNDFLSVGVYPFYFEDETKYIDRINETINTVLHVDLTKVTSIQADKIDSLKKLLLTICVSKPLEISIDELSKTVGITKPTLYKYIEYLSRAELVTHVIHEAKRFHASRKPDKLYLSNTNIFNALCINSDIGTLREAYFVSMLKQHTMHYTDIGDFIIDEKYIFEIGGKNKSFKQIKDLENSYIIADDIEVGHGNKISLWMMGFLY